MSNERREKSHFQPVTRTRRAVAAGIALFGFSVGMIGTACEGYSGEPTGDQEVASQKLKKSEKEDRTIRIRIVNHEDPKDPVSARSNPAKLPANWIRDFKPGDEEFDAIVVEPVEGYQQAEGDFIPWVAFDPSDGPLIFVRSDYVKRIDGRPLTEGIEIYETRPDRPDVIQPIGNAQ